MQNDALCSCYTIKLMDKVSIQKLHERAKLFSLERKGKQLLGLEIVLYQKNTDQRITMVNTRSQHK